MSTINNHIVHIHPSPEDETVFSGGVDTPARDDKTAGDLVTLVRSYRMRQTRIGKDVIATLLLREHGLRVSPCKVGRIIVDECLYFADTPLHWKKRLLCGKNGKCVHAETSPRKILGRTTVEVCSKQSFVQMRPEEAVHTHHTSLLRRIGIASVITNLAIVGMLAGMLLWEHRESDRKYNDSSRQALQQQADLPLHGAPSDSVVSH